MSELKYTKLDPNAIGPIRATPGSACLDLHALEAGQLAPGEVAAVGTGIALELPSHLEAQIRPRSGIAVRHGVTVLNSPGTVDSDYRGEVKVVLVNHGRVPFEWDAGSRIAQLSLSVALPAEPRLVEELTPTLRGAGGFGSTGLK